MTLLNSQATSLESDFHKKDTQTSLKSYMQKALCKALPELIMSVLDFQLSSITIEDIVDWKLFGSHIGKSCQGKEDTL